MEIKEKIPKNKLENTVMNSLMERKCKVFRKGFPDFLCLTSDNRLFFIEVKRLRKNSPKTGLSKYQKNIHNILKEHGFPVFLVKAYQNDQLPKEVLEFINRNQPILGDMVGEPHSHPRKPLKYADRREDTSLLHTD